MIILLFSTLSLIILFHLIGQKALSVLKSDASEYQFALTQIAGLSFLTCLASFCAFIQLSPVIFLIVLGFAVSWCAIGLIKRNRISKTRYSNEIFGTSRFGYTRLSTFSAMPGLIFASLMQRSWLQSTFTFRFGPDSFGWNDAALFFRNHINLNYLMNQIEPFLSGGKVVDGLQPGINATYSVAQIPSFADWANADFLLSARRTGLPYFVGSIGRLLPKDTFYTLFPSLCLWSIFVIAMIFLTYAKIQNSRGLLTFLCLMMATLNINLISTSLEGGLGQLIGTPSLILVLILMIRASQNYISEDFRIALICLIIFGISTYIDMLFVGLPIIFASGLLLGKSKIRLVLKSTSNWTLHTLILLFSAIPLIGSLYRIVINLFFHPSSSGWDQGKLPLPINVLGIYSALPTGMNHITDRSDFSAVLEFSLSILLLSILLKFRKDYSFKVFMVFLIFYIILTASIYLGPEPINNYKIWKFSSYMSVFFHLC